MSQDQQAGQFLSRTAAAAAVTSTGVRVPAVRGAGGAAEGGSGRVAGSGIGDLEARLIARLAVIGISAADPAERNEPRVAGVGRLNPDRARLVRREPGPRGQVTAVH